LTMITITLISLFLCWKRKISLPFKI
jgi:hypothetical protein